jgi:hypothetical protein
MVGVTPNVVPATTVNPASYPGWTQGDPGWANVGQNGSLNGVYIGDGWVLTAAHTGISNMQFDTGGPIAPIPGQDFQITNAAGSGLNPVADLRLFRISAEPSGVKQITIAQQAPLLNGQPGGEVMFIGTGPRRSAAESHFSVNTATDPDTWMQVASGGTFSGYFPNGGGKSWGTNNVANDNILPNEGDANFTYNVNDSSISYLVSYDQSGGTQFEAQAVGGDSGGAVFFNRNQGTAQPPQWELVGITINNFLFDGQSTSTFNPSNGLAVYGNATAFVDLSSYYTQITSTIAAHQDYSSVGDINLDGVAGTPADLAAFVAGWRSNNGKGAGTLASWKNGDVTHDGKTDVNDFLRLRSSLNAASGAELTAMMSNYLSTGGGVPEPSTAILVVGPVILLALRGRHRRPRVPN